MENENEKKGFFERLLGGKKAKKSSCCCNIELEEVPEENNIQATTSCCSCGPGCCDAAENTEKRSIDIDFLFLDLSVCTRCQGTDTALDEAIAEVSKVLEATGVEVVVRKINITTEDLAIEHKFISSPTIRVNGQDIQMEVKESLCESCGDLCGDEVDCRIWVYQGKEYTVPPKAMIIEAILKEVYGSNHNKKETQEYSLPENLKRFYAAISEKDNKDTGGSCC